MLDLNAVALVGLLCPLLLVDAQCNNGVLDSTGNNAAYSGAQTCSSLTLGHTTGVATTVITAQCSGSDTWGAITGCTLQQCTRTSTGNDLKGATHAGSAPWDVAGCDNKDLGSACTIKCNTYDDVAYAGDSTNDAHLYCVMDYVSGGVRWATTAHVNKCVRVDACPQNVLNGVTWNSAAVGASSSKTCDLIDSNLYTNGGSATRACTAAGGGTLGPIDFSNCVLVANVCLGDSVFDTTAGGGSDDALCITIDPVKYASGTATRTCSATGTWSATDLSACVKNQCAATGDWPATNVDEFAYRFCSETVQKATGLVSRKCEVSGTASLKSTRVLAFASADTSMCSAAYIDCPEDGPWQKTTSGQTAQVTCNAVNSGYASAAATHVATRACNNGVWQSPTITACTACAADASKGFNVDIAHGATDTVTCAVFDSVVHAGDTTHLVTRSCANGVVSYNYALCTAVCAANSGWLLLLWELLSVGTA